jgi:hypothetical protein
MMRARNIKPGFFKNEELAEIEPLGRILYEGLWCMSDREGRLEDRPKKIKAEILPYDDCDVDALLDQLAIHKFITRYEAGGERYIWIIKFKVHQNPHKKEPASTIPPHGESAAGSLRPEDSGPGISGTGPGNSRSETGDSETCSGTSGVDSGTSIPSPADSRSLIAGSRISDSQKVHDETGFGSGPSKSRYKDKNSGGCPEYLRIAQHLKDAILANKPDAHLPHTLDSWANTVRLMAEQDRRPVSKILQVIDWCQNDEFWSVNILSMDKLRKHFDRLELEMKRKKVVPFNGGNLKNRGDTQDGYGCISNLIIRAE